MSNKIWYLPGPFHQYREDVKALAKEHGLRIIDANITESRDGEADDVPEVTVRQIESASVLLIADSGDHAALQGLIDKLNAERDGIVLLIEAAEGLTELAHPGAGELPIRLFGALKAIHEGFETLAGERDNLTGEVESLRAEVARLKAIAEPVDNAEKIASLKAQLDAANVPYRANASVESLEKAVADLQQA
jgi:polyhydroxyalkanoate synthesis regulator phasin